MIKYIKTDVIGTASGIVYAKKGERVTIVNNTNDIWVAEHTNGKKFHVKPSKLSNSYVEPNMK